MGCPCRRSAGGMAYLSPRMKARMNELGLHAADLAGIAGSGAAGRVTIEDLEDFLDHRVLDAGAGTLLAGIVELLQKPETL